MEQNAECVFASSWYNTDDEHSYVFDDFEWVTLEEWNEMLEFIYG
jgi:hypothetical protein